MVNNSRDPQAGTWLGFRNCPSFWTVVPVQNCLKWSKWPKMVKNGPKWLFFCPSEMVIACPKRQVDGLLAKSLSTGRKQDCKWGEVPTRGCQKMHGCHCVTGASHVASCVTLYPSQCVVRPSLPWFWNCSKNVIKANIIPTLNFLWERLFRCQTDLQFSILLYKHMCL